MRNIIALRNGFVNVGTSPTVEQNENHKIIVMSTQAELMKFGYMLNDEAFEAMMKASTSDVIALHATLIKHLKDVLGVGAFRPFYINFPTQVMEMSAADLFWNAMVHYWSRGTWEPEQELKARGVAFENTKFKMLKPVIGDDWLRALADDLACFPKPLDEQRMADLIWIVSNIKDVKVGYISVKETLCTLGAIGINVNLTSAKDVLRIATKLSGGDISLPAIPKTTHVIGNSRYMKQLKAMADAERESFKFMKFNRPQRKYLLGLLENLKNLSASEMQSHLGRWQRLGEILHPGEFHKQFPVTFAAFNAIRNQKTEKVRTFAGMVDLGFSKSMEDGIEILKARPGEFARRLDSLVRKYGVAILPHFGEIAHKVSAKVIFEMYDHFEGRLKSSPRSVMLKGKGAKLSVLKDLPALPKETVEAVQKMVLDSMLSKFKKLPAMGKVFIDEELKNLPVPFSMQSSAEGVDTFVRGTRVKFNDGTKTLRGFVHWFDEQGHIDVDLSAGFYDEKLNEVGSIAFYELSNQELGACHSGDIRYRVGSCAEYIDIPLDKAIKNGVRYVIFTAYNYNGTSMASVPECTFGVMEREYPNSNEIFEPRTITSSLKVKAKSNSVSPVAFDLERGQWVWLDLERNQSGFVTLASDKNAKKQMEAVLFGSKLSVYELLKLHVDARGGQLVEAVDEADEVFLESMFQRDYSKLTPFMAV